MNFFSFLRHYRSFYVDSYFFEKSGIKFPKIKNIIFSFNLKSKKVIKNTKLATFISENERQKNIKQINKILSDWSNDIFELSVFTFLFFLSKKIKIGFKFVNDFKMGIFETIWYNFRFLLKKNFSFFFSFMDKFFLYSKYGRDSLIHVSNYYSFFINFHFIGKAYIRTPIIFNEGLNFLMLKNYKFNLFIENFVQIFLLSETLNQFLYNFTIIINFYNNINFFNLNLLNIFNLNINFIKI